MAPKRQENTKTWPFLNPAYDSYTNPVAPHEEPYLVSGLNVRTSSRGWLERAPGSVSYEGTPTALNACKRAFVYRKWNGDTFVMANQVSGTTSRVYKLKVGTDSAFVSLFTSTGSTNTGVKSPSAASAGTTAPVFANPSNVYASDDTRATVTFGGAGFSDFILVSGFGFSIPSNVTIDGVVVELERGADTASAISDTTVRLAKNGAATGTNLAGGGNWPTTDAYQTYGGSSNLWGGTWTSEDINASGFGVYITCESNQAAVARLDHVRITVYYSLSSNNEFEFVVSNNRLYYSNGLDSRSYDGNLERKWGITAPTTAATMTNAGTGITATSGWRYVYCYKDSVKGHISSPSPTSASTGAITDDTITVTVTGVAVGTTGVDKIQIFRSTDGGNGIFFYVGEVDNPGATTTTYADATADTSLNTQFSQQAPPTNYNDPPIGMRGLKSFANRIWGFVNGTLYYSGWEEINNGLEEESFPSGVTGNEWTAPQEIMALATLGGQEAKALLVFCRSKTFIITGDSRDTFSFQELFANLGCHVKVTGVAEDGDRVFFMGNDNRIYSTNGASKTLVSEANTDDLLNIASTDCAMVVHRYGEANWLIVADDNGGTTGANGARWHVLDLTTGKWQTPWAKNATHLFSGETSTGNFVLLYASRDASSNTIIRKLSIAPETAAWTDANGGQGTYTANAVFSLTELAPPGHVYEATKLTYHRNDTGSPTAPTIRAKFDEVNSGVTWGSETALTQNDPTLRTQGTVLIEKQAHFNQSGRNLLVRFEYAAENLNFKTLTLTLHHKEVGPLS